MWMKRAIPILVAPWSSFGRKEVLGGKMTAKLEVWKLEDVFPLPSEKVKL